jgi:cell division protein FtsZ
MKRRDLLKSGLAGILAMAQWPSTGHVHAREIAPDAVMADETGNLPNGAPRSSAAVKVIHLDISGFSIDKMIRGGVKEVEFITAHAKPLLTKSYRKEHDRIAEAIKGAHTVLIYADVDFPAEASVVSVIVEIARKMDVRTVVIGKCWDYGEPGGKEKSYIAELREHADALILIPYERLSTALGVCHGKLYEAGLKALCDTINGIAGIIGESRLIHIDFEDVRAVIGDSNMVAVGSASASGAGRAHLAAGQAIVSPLLEGVRRSGAKGVLVDIASSRGLEMAEVKEIMKTVREFAAVDAYVIFGVVLDDDMGDDLRVTIMAASPGQRGHTRA